MSASVAVSLADEMGFHVGFKIVAPDILHKAEAVGVANADEVARGCETILANIGIEGY